MAPAADLQHEGSAAAFSEPRESETPSVAPVASRSDSADAAAAARAGEEATNSPMPNASRVARADVADVYPPIRVNQGGGCAIQIKSFFLGCGEY